MPRAWVTSEAYGSAVGVLVQARTEAAMTQRDLAAKLGKPRSYVSKIETKERRIDMLEFIELSRALNVSPELLLSRVIAAIEADV